MKTYINILLSFTCIFLNSQSFAQITTLKVTDKTNADTSFSNYARKIMRLSDGRIFGSFGIHDTNNEVKLFLSSSDKDQWIDVSDSALKSVDARFVNSDTGGAGTYVSYVDGNKGIGEVLFYPDPGTLPNKFIKYSSLTPHSNELTDGFIAVSKGEEASNSVAYGWWNHQDNSILIGFSSNGRELPATKALIKDEKLRSGPSIAIHNKYIMVSYLSANPSHQPEETRGSDAAYPVYIESWDNGKNWSAPKAVLGTVATTFPKVDANEKLSNGKLLKGNLLAAGGAKNFSNSLAWPSPAIGARIFILSEQKVISKEKDVTEVLQSNPAKVGVLAFKDLSDGSNAAWNTVISSEFIGTLGQAPDNSYFQYSALPGTSLRAVSYKQITKSNSTEKAETNNESIVVSLSLNTGKSFDKAVKFSRKDLNLPANAPIIFTSSTCLNKNNKGQVSLDIAYLDNNVVKTAALPLGINLAELPPSMFNVGARWP